MELINNINHLRNQTLQRIQDDAKKGRIESLVKLTTIVTELDKLLNQIEQISNSYLKLKNTLFSSSSKLDSFDESLANSFAESNKEMSPKMRGEIKRNEFIKNIEKEGIKINHFKGVKYKINGQIIGIAYASERKNSRWFLGLPPEDYAAIILLCETNTKQLHDFIIDKDLFKVVKNGVAIDSNGGLKFNIAHKYGEYTLIQPHGNNIKITDHIHSLKGLYKLQ
jgi:hypothetical protein